MTSLPARPESERRVQVGGYHLLAQIGNGGMATIHRASAVNADAVVAIKLLKVPLMHDPELASCFAREAELMRSLHHENILRVEALGEHEGQPFMVMEHVDGVDLAALLEHRRVLPVDVAVLIGLGVARALAYAHARGVVHRDVKPANVLLSRGGEVKLTDFGIARAGPHLESAPERGIGTPNYMSPEQILGDRLDFRSDVFSLGVVLYQMVSGQRPFGEDASHTVLQRMQLDRYPCPRAQNPGVPRRLAGVIARCLEKQPRRRYEATDLLVAELERCLRFRTRGASARLVRLLEGLEPVSPDAAPPDAHALGGATRLKRLRRALKGLVRSERRFG